MSKNYIHNFDSGDLEFCQVCNSKDLDTILDLGYQPLADDLRPVNQKNQKTSYYPLKINLCRKCIMLQTSSIIEDETLYPKTYHYTPGISKQIRENFEAFAKKIAHLYKLKSSDLILDIGCADGSLLDELKNLCFKNWFGIEPTDTVKIAKKKETQDTSKLF